MQPRQRRPCWEKHPEMTFPECPFFIPSNSGNWSHVPPDTHCTLATCLTSGQASLGSYQMKYEQVKACTGGSLSIYRWIRYDSPTRLALGSLHSGIDIRQHYSAKRFPRNAEPVPRAGRPVPKISSKMQDSFLPKIHEYVLPRIGTLSSVEIICRKNEKLVSPQKLKSDSYMNHFFTQQLIYSHGPSAHCRCSGFPYRHKKNHMFTLLVGFVRPCYVNTTVSGPKKPFRSITKHRIYHRTTVPPLFYPFVFIWYTKSIKQKNTNEIHELMNHFRIFP